MGCPSTAPSATHGEVYLLVQYHASVGGDVLEVYGAVPVHIPVAGAALSVARATVCSLYIYSQRVVVEVDRVGDYGDDGEVIVFIPIDVGACDHLARQHSLLEESETVGGGSAHAELSISACFSIGEGGGGAIGGIA